MMMMMMIIIIIIIIIKHNLNKLHIKCTDIFPC
jgi:hypothetical protein